MLINFRVNDGGYEYYVSYDENMIVEDFIKDYLRTHTNYVSLDPKIYTFYAYTKCLNSGKFLKKTLKQVIRNDGLMHFNRKQDTHYSNKIKLIIKI